jgi:hypothetical protein
MLNDATKTQRVAFSITGLRGEEVGKWVLQVVVYFLPFPTQL